MLDGPAGTIQRLTGLVTGGSGQPFVIIGENGQHYPIAPIVERRC
jgi:hypothetical protein